MPEPLLTLNRTVKRDPAIEAWFGQRPGELGATARTRFEAMRGCGDEVREVLHDSCPVACCGKVPFGYVNVFTAHVNVGFFRGAALRDLAGLLQGSGRRMRHVKLKPGSMVDAGALHGLIDAAYAEIRARVEQD